MNVGFTCLEVCFAIRVKYDLFCSRATANRHLLRRLALLGNGTFDFFDTKTNKWKDQMDSLEHKLLHTACTSVSLKWTRHNQPDQELSQAPAKLPSIFSKDRLLVYGFIRHCTQATLKALIEDKEMETMVSTTELQKTTGTMLHKLTARALIRDYEDGILHEEEDENEMQKQLRKSEIINLSKEYSIVTQFTSFIAVEKRDADEQQDVEPNVLEIISAEDVDFLPYMSWKAGSDEEVEKERASSICKSDSLPKSEEDDAESQSSDFQLFDLCGSLACDFSEKSKRDHDEKYSSPRLYEVAHPVHYSEVEDAQESFVALDSLGIGILDDCADPLPISPQEDLKDTVRSSFLKKKKMSDTSIKLSAPLAAPAPSLEHLPPPPPPAISLEHMLPPPASFQFLKHVPPPPPLATPGESLKLPPGVTGMVIKQAAQLQEYSWTTAPPPPPLAAEEQLFTQSASIKSMPPASLMSPPSERLSFRQSTRLKSCKKSFKIRTVNEEEDASLCSQDSALHLPAAPGAPIGFGSSTGAILGPKPSEQEIYRKKKSSETLGSDLTFLYRPTSYAKILPAPIVSEPVEQPFWAPMAPPFSPSFQSSLPKRAGAALFGSSARGLSGETDFRDHMFPQTSIFSRTVLCPPSSFIQAMPTGEQPRADLKEDESSRKTKMRVCRRRMRLAVKRIPAPSWVALSALQTKEGFWMLTPELGKLLEINVPFLIDVFLMKKGIFSLGNRGKDDVCGLIATLLVLQAIRFHNLVNSINFKSLLKLDESSCTSESYQYIENAIKWARKVDQQYPGICVRLGLGKDWDFVTKQLLRNEPMKASSELQPALGIIRLF